MIYLVMYETKEGEKQLLTSMGGRLFALASDKDWLEDFLEGVGKLGNGKPAELLAVEGDGAVVVHSSDFEEIAYSKVHTFYEIKFEQLMRELKWKFRQRLFGRIWW